MTSQARSVPALYLADWGTVTVRGPCIGRASAVRTHQRSALCRAACTEVVQLLGVYGEAKVGLRGGVRGQ